MTSGAVATVAVAAIGTAAVTTVTGLSLLLTAYQGETNDREKQRDPKKQCTIHTRILQAKSEPKR